MANSGNIQNSSNDLRNFAKEASNLTTVLKELADALGKNAKEAAKFTGESADAYKAAFQDSVKIAEELSGITGKQLANKKAEAEIEKKISKVQQDKSRVQAKILELEDKLVSATAEESKHIKKTLEILQDVDNALESNLKHVEKVKERFTEISKIDVFAPFKEMMDRIPFLNKALPEMTRASQAFRNSLADGSSKMKALGVGAKELTTGLGQAALGAVLGKAVDEFVLLDERTVAMQRNLGVSQLEAYKMNDAMARASLASGKLYFNAERFAESQNQINSTLGSNGAISADMAENFAALHHQMGLSNEEATQFSLASMTMGKNAKDYTATITVQTKLLNGQKKLQIDNREIIKGIANTSSRIQLSYKASGQNLAQAVYQAKALGLNMSQVEKTADSLLDFESSIAAELEAELLTGKEYNLERARAAALTNDMTTLTTELANQGITAAKFGAMNRLEQEAVAKMLGMQADELGDSLVFQEQLKTVSKESGYRDAQSLEDLQKRVSLRAREVGMDKALAEIGDEKLRNQVDANTLQERMMLEQKKAVDALTVQLGPEKLQGTITLLQNSIDALTKAVYLMAGLQVAQTVMQGIQTFRGPRGPKGMNTPDVDMPDQSKGPTTKTSTPKTSTPKTSTPKPSGGGGLLGKVGNFFGGIAESVKSSSVGKFASKAITGVQDVAAKANPLNYASDTMKGALKGIGKFVGPVMTVVESVGSVYGAITAARAQKAAGNQVNPSDLGKQIVQGAAYPIMNASLNFIPAIGTALSILDGVLGAFGYSPLNWAAGKLAELVPTDFTAALGNLALKSSGPQKETRKMATGGIVTGATRATVGEAGPEAVVPLTSFYAKIDELIAAVKQGQNIYLGPNKLNEAIGLNLHSVG
jgi:hypothetical protein